MALLIAQQQALRDAQSRKDQPPKESTSADKLIEIHMNGSTFIAGSKIIPCPPYAPSVRPLDSLKKTILNDLRPETHRRGSYVLLRAAGPGLAMSGVLAIVEDENGHIIYLNLYYPDTSIPAHELLEKGQVLIVKEPYLKKSSDGSLCIRVDHLSDVIFLHVFDERVPEKWRQVSVADESVASTWRTRGYDFFKRSKFRFAIEWYADASTLSSDKSLTHGNRSFSKALQCSPIEAGSVTYIRAVAFLRVGDFESALADLKHPSIVSRPCATSLLRRAEALYGLERYRESAEVHKAIFRNFPGEATAKSKLVAAIRRVTEQERGQYRFREMQREAQTLNPPHLNHATYIGPVAIKPAGSRGRGLFTTAAVKAGDLLLCEKAFAHSDSDIVGLMVQKVHNNPALLPVLTDLHHGSYEPVDTMRVDGVPVVDS